MKMNQAWKKQDIELRPGTVVRGKWHHKSYVIQKKLGAGAVGSVFLAKDSNGLQIAIKISDQSASLTVEVNVLKSLQQVQGNRLGPSLFDVDDWKSPLGKTYSFYVMEYVNGTDLHSFIKNRGKDWIGVFMLQLLDDLEKLHQTGWVFGDLKPENLLIVSQPVRIRWIDVGGTTQHGRAIKEYTEFYDRGYWGMGTRKAEASYDLFSFVLIFIKACSGRQFNKGTHPKQTLFRKLDTIKLLKPFRQPLRKALNGKYVSASEMRRDLKRIMYDLQQRSRRSRKKGKTQMKQKQTMPLLADSAGIMIIACIYCLISLLL